MHLCEVVTDDRTSFRIGELLMQSRISKSLHIKKLLFLTHFFNPREEKPSVII